MLLAEVIGSSTCVIKVDAIKNTQYKIVKLWHPDKTWAGSYSLFEDSIGAGQGEIVLIAEDEVSIAKMKMARKIFQ